MIGRLLEKIAYGGTWIGLELGRLAARIFPRRLLIFLSTALAHVGYYLFRSFRRRSIHNLGLALGEQLPGGKIEKTIRGSLKNFFRAFIEIGIALAKPPQGLRAEIPLIGEVNLQKALAKGKGVIALGAHLGNFFLVGTRLAAEGYSANVLVNQPRHGAFARLLDRYRLKVGQKTIHSHPRREASKQLVQVLRKNELAIIIADEYRNHSGISVPFFGHMVLARRGPATLALRTGAAVVPINLIRGPDGALRLIIEPELDISRSGRTTADIRENTVRMTQWLERTIRSYPEQWNWMNIHWQEEADGDLIAKEQRYHGVAR